METNIKRNSRGQSGKHKLVKRGKEIHQCTCMSCQAWPFQRCHKVASPGYEQFSFQQLPSRPFSQKIHCSYFSLWWTYLLTGYLQSWRDFSGNQNRMCLLHTSISTPPSESIKGTQSLRTLPDKVLPPSIQAFTVITGNSSFPIEPRSWEVLFLERGLIAETLLRHCWRGMPQLRLFPSWKKPHHIQWHTNAWPPSSNLEHLWRAIAASQQPTGSAEASIGTEFS